MPSIVQPTWDDMLLDNTNDAHHNPHRQHHQEYSDPSSSSGTEAILQVWQLVQEEEDNKMIDDDDVIMHLDADEGLLNLNDFYDSISADASPPEQLLADAVLAVDSDSDANSFFSCHDDELMDNTKTNSKTKNPSECGIVPPQMSLTEFQESVQKLSKSMQKSQATRKSLYAQTPKLKDYQRSGTVETVLKRIEHSSHQIDTYYSSIRALK